MTSERTRAALQAAKVRGVALDGDRGNLPAAAKGAQASAALMQARSGAPFCRPTRLAESATVAVS